MKLKLGLDEDQSIQFSIGGGAINIDVPKNDNERYFVTASNTWDRYAPDSAKLSVPLGIDRNGDLVIINFSDSDSPHLLVGGTTGSGKLKQYTQFFVDFIITTVKIRLSCYLLIQRVLKWRCTGIQLLSTSP